MEGQTVGRSVGQRSEREGKGRRVVMLAVSCTDRERELERRCTILAEMKPNDVGQADDYRLEDFISGYQFEQSISRYRLTSLVVIATFPMPFVEMCATLLQITSERQELSDVPSTRLTQPQVIENGGNSEVIGTRYAFIMCIVWLL